MIVIFAAVFAGLLLGYYFGCRRSKIESFVGGNCNVCDRPKPCGCPRPQPPKPRCDTCNMPAGSCGCLNPLGPGGSRGNQLGPGGSHENSFGPGGSHENSFGPGGEGPQERPFCPPCAPCAEPDPSKWVLKASVPPCPPMPEMSKYMLKTECPPQPDMSKYVLKSSVPKCPPCISTCSKPCKIGECPPCPRPRCPVVKCPEPKACPACPESRCAPCPEPDIKCKASYEPGTPVRPMLASTSTFGF